MKNRNLMLLALAIGCGLVAAFLTARLSAGGSKTEMVSVLVAAKNIDQGTKLDDPDKYFVRKPFPKESVPPEFIDDIGQLKDKVLNRSIRAGTHCTMGDVKTKDSIDLPIGADGTMYKGMAIRVSQHTAVSGFINPGDHVDVVVIDRLREGKTTSTLLLQNVLVVAINEIAVKPDGTAGAVKNATTVTLAVKQKEGLILSLAQAKGELNLMLRSKDDPTVVTKGARVVDGYDGKDEASASAGDTVKVPVARHDIAPGAKIENPSDLFEEKEFPEVVLAENTIRDIAELKGKTVTRYAYAGAPVAKAVFEGELAQPGGPAAPVIAESAKIHMMAFQVGTQQPQFVKYNENGRLLEGGQAINVGAPAKSEKAEKGVKPSSGPAFKPDEKTN